MSDEISLPDPGTTKIATGIKTEIFFGIIEDLKKDKSWKLTAEYADWCFYKGIDFDFYQFESGDSMIMFAWTNWFEGEISATDEMLSALSTKYSFELQFGEAEYLHDPKLIKSLQESLSFRN